MIERSGVFLPKNPYNFTHFPQWYILQNHSTIHNQDIAMDTITAPSFHHRQDLSGCLLQPHILPLLPSKQIMLIASLEK